MTEDGDMTSTNTNTSKSNGETWSGEDQIYDYLAIPGLNTKFGLNGERL